MDIQPGQIWITKLTKRKVEITIANDTRSYVSYKELDTNIYRTQWKPDFLTDYEPYKVATIPNSPLNKPTAPFKYKVGDKFQYTGCIEEQIEVIGFDGEYYEYVEIVCGIRSQTQRAWRLWFEQSISMLYNKINNDSFIREYTVAQTSTIGCQQHKYTMYVGLRESYEYCTVCDRKKA